MTQLRPGVGPLIKVAGIDFDVTTTTQIHEMGAQVPGTDGRLYIYILASATITAGDALFLTTGAGAAYRMAPTSAVAQPVQAIAHVAIASASYGWAVRGGDMSNAKLTAATAAGAVLASGAVAGTLITITAATPSNAEVIAAIASAAGIGITCRIAESGGRGTVFLGG